MSKKRNRYAKEFKRQIVELHKAGKTVNVLSREYGINENIIHRWVRELTKNIDNGEGIKVSLIFVQRRMSELNIKSKIVRNFKHFSTKIDINGKVNILCQNFIANRINQKLCADITYIWIKEDGWTYLAEVIDLYSKKIIGFVYSKGMTTELAISAIKNALSKIKNTKGIILHTDLGSKLLSNKLVQ